MDMLQNNSHMLLLIAYKGEYVPTGENDGMLIHENSKSCKRTYAEFHAEEVNHAILVK